jgi:branched-chain amino acid transport system permease protein
VGTDILPTGAPWGSDTATFLGITVPQTRIAAAIVAIALMGAFYAAFKYSDWGVAMRSTAADPETAALMGIRLSRVAAGAWAVSGFLAAIAGAFFTSFPASGVSTTTYLLALTAIPAAVLGGLDSITGAVVGGLVIGVSITFTAGYQDELSFLGRGLSDVIPYVVLLLVLLWRPSGLFGTREISRV